jgi:putative ABC transport system substrate-binding protein
MAKEGSRFAVEDWKIRRLLVNTNASWPDLIEAKPRVLKIQTKLHQWAKPHRHGPVESRMRGDMHVRFGGAGRGNGPAERRTPRPDPTPAVNSLSRRAFVGSLAGLGVSTAAFLGVAGCSLQQAPFAALDIRRLGVLSNGSTTDLSWSAFRQGLAERGWTEGRNLGIEWRVYGSDVGRLSRLAAELVGLSVDLIATQGSEATAAAKLATGAIPIVFCGIGDPVGTGLVRSLAHPEANLTGTTQLSTNLIAKRLSLLIDTLPQAARIAYLHDSRGPVAARLLAELQAAAGELRVQLEVLDAHGPADIEPALSHAVDWGAEALMVVGTPSLYPPSQMVRLVAQTRLPAMYDSTGGLVEAGALMSYGPNFPDLVRRTATDYVDPILRREKRPADLPVQQPTTFEFKVNQTTAWALGLTIPPDVAAQVTEWVQ